MLFLSHITTLCYFSHISLLYAISLTYHYSMLFLSHINIIMMIVYQLLAFLYFNHFQWLIWSQHKYICNIVLRCYSRIIFTDFWQVFLSRFILMSYFISYIFLPFDGFSFNGEILFKCLRELQYRVTVGILIAEN